MKKIGMLMVMIIGVSLMYSITKAQNTMISLDITAGHIAIDSSWTINIWAINSSPIEINQIFSINSFRMLDLRWGAWYHTTIQFGDLIKWGDRIANTNIQFKTIHIPFNIYGEDNSYMKFGSGIRNQYASINQPMTYFIRNLNEWTWSIGLFGDTPEIKITVPSNQPAGTYRGIIYYTLIDKE